MNDKWREFFDKGVDRRGTDCLKWDGLEGFCGNGDAIALWVADMDFSTPQQVIDAMVERAKHGAFGYTEYGEKHFVAFRDWMQNRHGLSVEKDWILTSDGVVDSMVFCLRAMAKEGTRVAIFSPCYGPFFSMPKLAGYDLYISPLLDTPDGWKMDLDNLEDGFKQGDISVFMLCNPHNPVGRVWTRDELERFTALCNRYGVQILSDEIHMDFEMPGYKQVPMLTVKGAEDSVMLTSATKTFNLAALRHSSIIAPNKDVRCKIVSVMSDCMAASPNLFGYIAQTAAYTYGGEWLDNLILYLDESSRYTDDFLKASLPEIQTAPLEGTYLKFLDMRELGMEHAELVRFLSQKACIALGNGLGFGEEGRCFMRMNIATPRANIEEALDRLAKAVRG
ncbi:MAG: MalY/PatB family protein [Christensenellales bacterium]